MRLFGIMIFLLPVFILEAQTDFLINEENTPSTFIQSNPRLFTDSHLGFIVAWEDPRDGGGYYAQRFNTGGQPYRVNFPVASNMSAVYGDDGSVVVLHQDIYATYRDWGWITNDCHYDIYGTKYDVMGNLNGPYLLSSAIMFNCFVYWGALDQTFHYFDNSFILTRLFLGDLWVKRLDAGMQVIFEDTIGSYYNGSLIYVMTTAVVGNNGYMISWVNGEEATIPFGLYGTFFDAQNNILADSVFVYDVDFSGNINMLRFPFIRSLSIGDSLYQVFYIHPDSLTLTYRKTTIDGIPLGNTQFVRLLDIEEVSPGILYDLRELQLSPIPEGGFAAVISLGISEPEGIELIMYFSEEGEFTGEIQTYTASHRRFEHGVAFTGERDFIVTGVYNDDIWLYTYNDFNLSDSIKINDDPSGGAQISPNITLDSDGNYFVCWHDEQFTRGRKVSAAGIPSGEQVELESKNIVFLSTGNIIQKWDRKLDESTWAVGLSWFDTEWNLIREDTLTIGESGTSVEGIAATLADSAVIILYRNRSDTFVRIMNSAGSVIRESIIDGFTSGSPLKLYVNGYETIWLGRGNRFVHYSAELQQISNIIIIPGAIQEYIGLDRFIGIRSTFTNYDEQMYYGNLYDSEGAEVATNILLTVDANEVIAKQLDNEHFIVLFTLHSIIYAQVFDLDGNAIAGSFKVAESIEGRKKNPAFSVHNDNVLFVWADARIPGSGFDIYGRIFSLKDITTNVEQLGSSIPQSFILYQNYPNPFNPTTLIEYAVPRAGNVHIAVYDLLGREVTVLADEYHQAGAYRVTFDAGRLASGVYMYRLKAEDYTNVKRMVLVR
jgi:hypothetical protein